MVKKVTKYKIIMLYLNDYNRSYYLRELASILQKPHQTIKPYVEGLVKEGILKKNKRKNIVEYSINNKNEKTQEYLIISEKEKLMNRLLEETILNLLYEKLSNYFNENTFIIFGSASEQIKKGSDIDLLLIGKKNISRELKDFEEVYNKKIHKIQITSMDKLTPSLIIEIYKKHLIFNNTEKVLRFFRGLYEENKLV